MAGPGDGDRWVVIGRISGLYGVRGWVRVRSETDPREAIVDYSPWYLQRGERWDELDMVQQFPPEPAEPFDTTQD